MILEQVELCKTLGLEQVAEFIVHRGTAPICTYRPYSLECTCTIYRLIELSMMQYMILFVLGEDVTHTNQCLDILYSLFSTPYVPSTTIMLLGDMATFEVVMISIVVVAVCIRIGNSVAVARAARDARLHVPRLARDRMNLQRVREWEELQTAPSTPRINS